ncbi:hypothetical protein [Nonomuraea sp. NPDC048826]|uniref:hypothetical protein n=1 Tax=Nonomuraea sp. NPDC048826 TaxID=3364347 RepID=UPI00371F9A2D
MFGAVAVGGPILAGFTGARVAYVELKAPGRGVPTVWTPNKHEKTQWEKLRLLPNVLYTDGALWAVFRDGELVGQIARLNGDIRKASDKLAPLDGEFARVLSDFLLWKPNSPRNIHQLVRAVAGLCKLLRSEVIETIGREHRGEEKPKIFTKLSADWRKLLFTGLTYEDRGAAQGVPSVRPQSSPLALLSPGRLHRRSSW